jgi:hypothetical protein
VGHDSISAATQVYRGFASPLPVTELLEYGELQAHLNVAPLHSTGCALALGITTGTGWRTIDPAELIPQIASVFLNAGNWGGINHLNGSL